ncbi:Cyclin-like F-box [Lecanosticta acicola]|uniref:Cyclin-like F-box n=1 Tax=Lecanosticta acicola TaxID=111012 RepID=A0AAI9E9L1_9PEZI|nr:Cyclin-like F-box [Lecanosticta acicola]
MSSTSVSSPSLADLTYARPNLKDNTLNEQELDRLCPLDFGKHDLEPRKDLGGLERLPYELIAEILALLDLRSLFDFRRVNQRAMQAIDALPQLKQILKYNVTLVRAMLSVEVGSRYSCTELLDTLKARDCRHCGDFAGYIDVLQCKRVCFLCFSQEQKDYLPLTAAQACQKFGIDRSRLLNLSHMKAVPGRYSPNDKLCRKRSVLYDPESAQQAGTAWHGSQEAMRKAAADHLAQKVLEYENRMEEYLSGVIQSKPRRPTGSPEEHDGRSSNPRRYMAIVRAPSLAEGISISGFHCTGCQREYRSRPLHWRRKYTDETFRTHIQQGGVIRDGRHEP